LRWASRLKPLQLLAALLRLRLRLALPFLLALRLVQASHCLEALAPARSRRSARASRQLLLSARASRQVLLQQARQALLVQQALPVPQLLASQVESVRPVLLEQSAQPEWLAWLAQEWWFARASSTRSTGR
jgi:hypothetical protein